MMFCPFGAYVFISLGGPTRGYAPGYDALPLRGDRSAHNTPPPGGGNPSAQIHRPTATAPKGHRISAQGAALGWDRPHAPKGQRISAQGAALGEGAQPWVKGRSPGSEGRNPSSDEPSPCDGVFLLNATLGYPHCVSPRWGLNFLGMHASTRGYAPGYDVLPLRGDRSAHNTPPPGGGNPSAQIHRPTPNGHRPEGAKDVRPGPCPGPGSAPRPEGAKDISPGRSPGMGRSVPFLPILKPRRGVTQPPMSRPHAMGCFF